MKIRDPKQPLLIAEKKTKIKKLPKGKSNKDSNEKDKNQNDIQEEPTIYLVPELLFITGTNNTYDSRDKRRNIM